MDSSPDIIGRALAGTFNTSDRRKKEYEVYFKELRKIYIYKFNLLKTLVSGIDSITDKQMASKIELEIKKTIDDKKQVNKLLKGLPYVEFLQNLEPESGFFAILDFTKVKGMKYKNDVINTEKDLLKFFYKTSRTRFLVGQSISWPYKNELVGRVTYALENEEIINALKNMNVALSKLTKGDDYIIRKNELKDQEQMAKIKVDGWQSAYDKNVSSKYLKKLDYKAQTERYIASFDEYKHLVLVADRNEDILGYSCFDLKQNDKYDSELVSLYIKPKEIGKGIGTTLFKETVKELLEQDKKNMIVWCFKDNKKAIKFYEKLGGKNVETKTVKIGEKYYQEYGFYFDLESFI